MNTKAIYVACLFAALNICTLSARAEADVTPKTYTYGTHLDIKKVLSLKQDGSSRTPQGQLVAENGGSRTPQGQLLDNQIA
jgi:hypothetical protein